MTDGQLKWKDGRSAMTKRDGLYVIRNAVTITIDETAQAVDASVQRSSAVSFSSRLLEMCKESSKHFFCVLCERELRNVVNVFRIGR